MQQKTSFLLFLIIGISLSSCRKVEEVTKVTYRFDNQSGHEMQISAYFGNDLVQTETIKEGSILEIFKVGEGGTTSPIEGDSAYVLFKAPDKFLAYLLNQESGAGERIYNDQNFDSKLLSDDGETKVYIWTFTFTPEDYDQAEPL